MGFGLLFIGYLIAFPMTLTMYGWAIRILGCIVMMIGCKKLCDYFRGFIYVEMISAVFALTGVAEGVLTYAELPDAVQTVESWVWFGTVLVFHLVLNWELNLADASVGIERQRSTALTAVFISVLWFLTYVFGITQLIPPGFYWLMFYVLMIITAVAIYGSYRHIAPAGESDTVTRRKTGIGFIDKFFAELDRREARAIESTRAEIEERQRKREASRAGGKRKKRK